MLCIEISDKINNSNTVINKDEQLDCMICSDIFSNNIKTSTLKCGHKFCHDCIFDWYKQSVNCYSTGSKIRECPYCRQDGGYLELLEGEKPLKNIHLEYKSVPKNSINNKNTLINKGPKLIPTICGASFSTKPGNCSSLGKNCYFGYCGKHKNHHLTNPKTLINGKYVLNYQENNNQSNNDIQSNNDNQSNNVNQFNNDNKNNNETNINQSNSNIILNNINNNIKNDLSILNNNFTDSINDNKKMLDNIDKIYLNNSDNLIVQYKEVIDKLINKKSDLTNLINS